MSYSRNMRHGLAVTIVVALFGCGSGSDGNDGEEPQATPSSVSATPSSVLATPSPSGDARAWAAGDVIVRSNNGGLDWEVVRPAGGGLTSVAFADRAAGWAVAAKTVLHSTDGGDTWTDQSQALVPATIIRLNAVTALSAARAVVVGGGVPPGPFFSFGSILTRLTTDGGATWEFTIFEPRALRGELRTMCFTDVGIGFGCGVEEFGLRFCALSEDAGNSWFDIAGRVRGDAVACVGDATLWTLTGLQGFVPSGLSQSTDGGLTWVDRSDALPASFQGLLLAVSFATEMDGWVVGRDDTGHPAVLHTNDGGDSWEAQVLPGDLTTGPLRAVQFADSLRGVAVGQQLNTAGGPTALGFATTDGGAVWQAASFPPNTPPLESLAVVP